MRERPVVGKRIRAGLTCDLDGRQAHLANVGLHLLQALDCRCPIPSVIKLKNYGCRKRSTMSIKRGVYRARRLLPLDSDPSCAHG